MWMTISCNSFCMYVYVEYMCICRLACVPGGLRLTLCLLDQFLLYLLRQKSLAESGPHQF